MLPIRQSEEMEGFSPGWTGWGAGEEQLRSVGEEGLVLTTPSLVKASWPRDRGADSPGKLLQERRVGGRVGFGRPSYCILWSLDLFKLLCTQHLNTVLTRAAEVSVALNVSSASAKQGPWCGRFVFRHMEEKHGVHYRVGRARGQLHGGASSPSL